MMHTHTCNNACPKLHTCFILRQGTSFSITYPVPRLRECTRRCMHECGGAYENTSVRVLQKVEYVQGAILEAILAAILGAILS